MAFVSAGLAVETNMPYMAKIKDWHEVPVEGGLPPLPDFGVFLYVREDASPLALQLAGIIRDVDFNPSAIAKRGLTGKAGTGTGLPIHTTWPIDRRRVSGKTPCSAGVAQLVEHPICNRAVGSSSLSTSTIPSCTSLICQHFMC